jgi:hypothetical protein
MSKDKNYLYSFKVFLLLHIQCGILEDSRVSHSQTWAGDPDFNTPKGKEKSQ